MVYNVHKNAWAMKSLTEIKALVKVSHFKNHGYYVCLDYNLTWAVVQIYFLFHTICPVLYMVLQKQYLKEPKSHRILQDPNTGWKR